MLVTALLIQTILAVSVFALPASKERPERRVTRRTEATNSSDIAFRLQSQPAGLVDEQRSTNSNGDAQLELSNDYAGVVLVSPEGTYKEVSTVFSVPVIKKPPGEDHLNAAAALVGIDGYSCSTAPLRAGINLAINSLTGEHGYEAFYEWSHGAEYLSDFAIEPEDEMFISVIATTPTTGTIKIENISTGQIVSRKVSGLDLCLQDAMWVVQGGLVPLVDFGTITFTDAIARTVDGELRDPTDPDAHVLDILQNGYVHTASSARGDKVTVRFIHV